jgi:hypothetical protein
MVAAAQSEDEVGDDGYVHEERTDFERGCLVDDLPDLGDELATEKCWKSGCRVASGEIGCSRPEQCLEAVDPKRKLDAEQRL